MTTRLLPVLALALAFSYLLRYFLKELRAVFDADPVESMDAKFDRATKGYFLVHVGVLLVAILLSVVHRTIAYLTYFAFFTLAVYGSFLLLSTVLVLVGFLLYFLPGRKNRQMRTASAGITLFIVATQAMNAYMPHFCIYFCFVFYLEMMF